MDEQRPDCDPMAVAIEVLGVRIDLRLPADGPQSLRRQVESAWDHCVIASAVPSALTVRWRGNDLATGLHLLSQDVTRAAIDAHAGRAMMLHAAAIADADSGATLVVVGASGGGKTTWVQTHGRHRRYLSDETVLITPDLRVLGVPKPLSLGHRGELKRQVPPADFGFLKALGTEHLAALWLLNRGGAPVARLTEVDLLDALPLLAQQASYLRELPRPLHQMAAIVTAGGGLKRADYREAADLAPLVDEVMT